MTETRPIDSIKVGDRIRKDMGDLDALAENIREHGPLLQPILIEEDGTLIAGGRRLAACKRLGRTEIEVYVPAHQNDALERVRKELDENDPTLRKDFTPTEMVARGLVLEELEKPAAEERELSGKPSGDSPEGKGDTREKVGKALGVGGKKYEQAKKVVKAAEDGDDAAKEAAKEMDRTGNVNGAYNKVFKRDGAKKTFFGKGDKWDDATDPLVRYLRAQKKKNFDFSHLNWKEAKKRVQRIDGLIADLEAARADLEPRSHKAKLSF